MGEREDLIERAKLINKARAVRKTAAPVEEKSTPMTIEEAGNMANAAAQGFGQGASMGYLPQLQAMAEPVFSKVGDAVMGTNTYDDMPSYETRRDQWIQNQLKLQKENPGSYVSGQLAGGLSSALAVPQATLAKTAGLGTKIAASLAAGGTIRALQNPGDVQGEFSPMQLGERVSSVMDPKAAAIDAVAPTLGPLMTKGAGALKGAAEATAFKALGPYAKQAKSALAKDRINEIGREVLDSGAISWLPKSYSSLQEKLSSLRSGVGQDLNTIYDSAKTQFKDKINKVGFDPIRDKADVLASARAELGDSVGSEAALQKVSNYLDEVAGRFGNKPEQAAQSAYKEQVAEYMPKFKQYLKEKRSYQNQLGQAGENIDQMTLPGVADDFQRTSQMPVQVEVSGQAPQVMESMPAEYGTQMDLTEMFPGRGSTSNMNPKTYTKRVTDKNFLEQMNENALQGEMQGLELTPRSYVDADVTGVRSGTGQMQFPMAPTAPLRPVNPGSVRNPMDPRRANDIKTAIDTHINYSRDPLTKDPTSEVAFMGARKAIAGKVDQSIKDIGGDDLLQQLQATNKKYGNFAEANNIVSNREARHLANRLISPSDYGVGMVGAVAGGMMGGSPEERAKHALMGASLGLANKGARLYGNQIAAKGLNAAGYGAKGAGYILNQGAVTPLAQGSAWNTLYNNSKKDKP